MRTPASCVFVDTEIWLLPERQATHQLFQPDAHVTGVDEARQSHGTRTTTTQVRLQARLSRSLNRSMSLTRHLTVAHVSTYVSLTQLRIACETVKLMLALLPKKASALRVTHTNGCRGPRSNMVKPRLCQSNTIWHLLKRQAR